MAGTLGAPGAEERWILLSWKGVGLRTEGDVEVGGRQRLLPEAGGAQNEQSGGKEGCWERL